MKFEMNGTVWEIQEKDESTIQEYAETDDLYYGVTLYFRQQIFILNGECQSLERMKKTLYHELTHVYIHEYISTYGIPKDDEDFICDIMANSHDIIHNIVEDYFKTRERELY